MLAGALQVFDYLDRTVGCRTFLIRRDKKAYSALVIRMSGHESLTGNHHCRQAAFHVGRTTAVQQAVADRRCIGV